MCRIHFILKLFIMFVIYKLLLSYFLLVVEVPRFLWMLCYLYCNYCSFLVFSIETQCTLALVPKVLLRGWVSRLDVCSLLGFSVFGAYPTAALCVISVCLRLPIIQVFWMTVFFYAVSSSISHSIVKKHAYW